MTTPAAMLESMHYELRSLTDLVCSRSVACVVERIEHIEKQADNLVVKMERIEDHLAIIIKLLGKHE